MEGVEVEEEGVVVGEGLALKRADGVVEVEGEVQSLEEEVAIVVLMDQIKQPIKLLKKKKYK